MQNNAFGPLNQSTLEELVSVKMPFGKYANRILCDLPEAYLLWFYRKGFPPGHLGELLAILYEIRINGLGYLLTPLRNNKSK